MSVSGAIRGRLNRILPPKVVNLWCHITDAAVGSFGQELVGRPVLAGMITALSPSPVVLGFFGSIYSYTFLAQLLFAPRIEAVRLKKRLVLRLGFIQRLGAPIIAGALVLWGTRSPTLCLVGIGLARLLGACLTSLQFAPAMDLVGETIPPDRLSRLFGFRCVLGNLLRLAVAGVCLLVLGKSPSLHRYAWLYLLSFAAVMVSWGLFSLVDEMPPTVRPPRRQRAGAYFRDLIAAVRADRNYRHYLLFLATQKAFDELAIFYFLAAEVIHGMPKGYVAGVAITAFGVTGLIGNLLLPFVAERIGHKRLLAASVVLRAGGALVALWAPDWQAFVLTFVVAGFGRATYQTIGPAFMLRAYPRGKRIGYTALASLAMAPVRLVAGPVAGVFVAAFAAFAATGEGLHALFGGMVVLMLAGLIPLALCNPPPMPTAEGGREGEGCDAPAGGGDDDL